MARPKKRLGEILVDAGVISADDLAHVLKQHGSSREKLGEALVRLGLATETQIALAVADQLGIPFVDLTCTAVEPEAIQLIPERTARRHVVVPISISHKELQVAIADPLRLEALEDVAFAAGCTVRPVIATISDITQAIDKHYHLGVSLNSLVKDIEGDHRHVEVVKERQEHEARDSEDLRRRSEAAPIVRMVNLIIAQAVEQGASDIHIEPNKGAVLIRTRVDGLLRELLEAPKWVQGPVTSRIKIMARMDIAEKRMPQDGRIAVRVNNKSLDLRVSTVPSAHGEKVVIRVLDSANSRTPLEAIGLEPRELALVDRLLHRPQGIVLVTGPTGAGKTSTLYAMLNRIRTTERNITTIEDPIEYELTGINQTAVQDRIGLTFAAMLRATLRQDPDVIMVGEMRDLETATIAMQASVTGHLVLSTMHTNSAIATVTRVRNLGIAPYVIASSVSGILAQRLVRRICDHCKVEAPASLEDRDRLRLLGAVRNVPTFVGRGCSQCHNTGYKGRVAVFEILPVDAAVRDLIAASAPESQIRRAASAAGFQTLMSAGLKRVRAGLTTVAEVCRVIDLDEQDATVCTSCGEPTDPDFLGCPSCGERLVASCPGCERRVGAHWKMCAYCCTDLQQPAAA